MPQKRVPESVYRRRRMTALAIIILLIILLCVLIGSCSKDDDKKGNKKQKSKTAQTTIAQVTTMPTALDNQLTVTTTAIGGLNGDGVTMGTAPASADGSQVEKIDLTFYTVTLNIGEKKMPIVTMSPATATDKSEIWETSNKAVATVDEKGNITAVGAGTCYITVTSKSNLDVYAEVKVTVNQGDSLDVTQTSELNGGVPSEVTYVKGVLIANKSYGLPADYNPGLDATAKSQFDILAADAKKEGLNIYLASGFRSYEYQSKIYNNYVSLYGQATADTFSARPGYSEHQTGLAIDVNTVDDSFAATEESKWLASNAHKYGFIIRYPKGKDDITGYQYESWHIRYLGVETATAVYNSGLTLEEYLGVDSKYRG